MVQAYVCLYLGHDTLLGRRTMGGAHQQVDLLDSGLNPQYLLDEYCMFILQVVICSIVCTKERYMYVSIYIFRGIQLSL